MAIKDLFVRLLFENKQFKSGMKDAGDELKDFGKKAGDASKDAGVLGAAFEKYLGPAALGATVASLANATWSLAEMGAQSLALERNLNAFAGGAANAVQYTDAIVAASGRAVDQMQAAEVATGMLQMGIADTTDEMSLYIEGATRLGKQSESAGQRIESMMQFLKNLNLEMADNFGLSRQVLTARTEELQVTQGLTREQALLQATQEEITRQLGILGPRTQTETEAMDAMKVAAANVRIELGERLAPAVADLAREAADAIPKLWTTIDQLAIMANASIFWAEAALQGRDAELAFNAAVAESIGATEELTRIEVQAAQERMAVATEQIAAIDAQIAAEQQALAAGDMMASKRLYHLEINREVIQGEYDAAQAIYNAGRAMMDGAAAAYEMRRENLLTARSMEELAGAAEELGMGLGLLDKALDMRSRVIGMIPEPFLEAMDIIEKEQDRLQTEMIRKAVLRGTEEERAAERATNAWEDAAEAQRRAYEDLKNTIQQALQPTEVTALDTYQAGLGQYVEKWDEAARQLDAIAERGFAEIAAHPEWANILKIPPEILAANEDVLKEWARSVSDAVRDLERPDLLNVDAAVEAVRQELARQAAVEMSLDIVAKAAIEAGVVGGVDARQQVSEALGLTQPLPVNLNLATGTQANLLQTLDASNLGMQAGDQLLIGLRAELSTGDAIRTWTVWLNREVTTAYGGFRDVGKHAAEPVKQGFISGLTDANFLAIIAAAVSPLVAAQMDSDETYGGEY